MAWRTWVTVSSGFCLALGSFILALVATAITVNPFNVLSIIGQPPAPPGQFVLNLTTNAAVPASTNYVICRGINLNASNPLFGTSDLHATSFTPFFNSVGIQAIALYSCTTPVSTSTFQCGDLLAQNCTTVWGWTQAANATWNTPSMAGVHFGNLFPRWAVVQAQYNTATPLNDSSFVSVSFTSTLRSYDLGVFTVGVNPNSIVLYPNQSSAFASGNCSAASTSAILPSTPSTTVVAYMPHTHSLGTGFTATFYHTGNAPFSIGASIYPSAPSALVPTYYNLGLFPGDTYTMNCTYNTMSAPGLTTGGLGPSQELCYMWWWVYPAVPAVNATCTS